MAMDPCAGHCGGCGYEMADHVERTLPAIPGLAPEDTFSFCPDTTAARQHCLINGRCSGKNTLTEQGR